MMLKKLLVIFIAVISIASCNQDHKEGFTYSPEGLELYEKKKEAYLESLRKDIVFSGDSLTRGVTGFDTFEMGLVDSSYPQLLMRGEVEGGKLCYEGLANLSWINTSEPGLTTEKFVETLYRRIQVMRPKVVVITIGGNDLLNKLNSKGLNLDSSEGRDTLKEWLLTNEQTSQNIEAAVQALTASNSRVVFGLIRPGGMFTEMFEAEGYPEIAEAMHGWYGRILSSLKALNNDKLYLVEDIMEDIWSDHISADGIHPTQQGYHLMAKNFNLSFQKALKDL